jgi:predicted metal-binding membrane protein
MMALSVTGVMNLSTMARITIAIIVERLAPSPTLVARASGVVMIVAGVLVIARGASHGWSL